MDAWKALRPARVAPRMLALTGALLLALAGCGGGEQFGIGTGGSNDPPTITLILGAETVQGGTTIQLLADASDDDAVVRVVFYSVAADNKRTELGSDTSRPYVWPVTLPAASAGTARFVARAVDNDGEETDSATLAVTLTD